MKYTVSMPSFLASVDITTTLKEPQASGVTWVQFFATGETATALALRPDIRKVLLERLDPEVAAVSDYAPDENTTCITKWLAADKDNRKRLRDWMATNKVRGRPTDLLDGDRYAADRAKAAKDKDLNITVPCP
jgi:hypothetical protein